jgi:hypothetical protein
MEYNECTTNYQRLPTGAQSLHPHVNQLSPPAPGDFTDNMFQTKLSITKPLLINTIESSWIY